MQRHQISWWLWAVGTVLIALSWFGVVSPTIGWCGFGIAMVGSVLGWGLRPPQSTPPPALVNNKMQAAIAAVQQDVIVAAEQKLGRLLTEPERRGIRSIDSLMMLESCHRSFSSPASTPAQVLADVEHFAKLHQTASISPNVC